MADLVWRLGLVALGLGEDGKPDAKGRSRPRPTVDVDEAVVAADEGEHGGKAEPRTPVARLRRKEGLENARARPRVHAYTGVGDAQHRVARLAVSDFSARVAGCAPRLDD